AWIIGEEDVVFAPRISCHIQQRFAVVQRFSRMQGDGIAREHAVGKYPIAIFVVEHHAPFLTCHRESMNQFLSSVQWDTTSKPACCAIDSTSSLVYLQEYSMWMPSKASKWKLRLSEAICTSCASSEIR